MIVKLWLRLALSVSLLIVLTGQALANSVTMFAAASLTNALQDIGAQYKQEKQVDVVLSFASSSTLARQIEAGAPADLYMSADQSWMDYVQKNNSIDVQSRKTLLSNSLVVIVPKDSSQMPLAINEHTDWDSLLQGGRLAVGDPQHVPVGIYAKQALEKLGAWNKIESKLAPTQDVRSGLVLVERSEVSAGIVYSSDALVSPGVKVVGSFPPETYPKVEYPLAIVAGHDNPVVRAFYDYLQGPQAAAIFKQYGFITRQ